MKLFGKILTALGVLSLILGIIGAVLAGMRGNDLADALNAAQPLPATVEMEEGETRMVVGDSADATCTVSPEGATFTAPPSGTSGSAGEETIVGVVQAESAGSYAVTCDGSGMEITGPASLGDMIAIGLGALGAILLIPLGLLLLVVGGLLWFFGRRKKNQAQTSYTSGTYQDQFSRSAPYTQGGAVPPAPGQYDQGQPGYGQQTYGQPAAPQYGQSTPEQTAPPAPGQYGQTEGGSSSYGQAPYGQTEGGSSPYGQPDAGQQGPSFNESSGQVHGAQRWDADDLGDRRDDGPTGGGQTPPPPPPSA
ncbi:hypothetical protein SAMN05445756_0413 [Kytococcus aerolatus]|uniref:Uncharacterized protein n=2 Tax=Kytococcus aerolatus TaxID=592308 RepID=A0A212T5J3_9MICO|nr:hypothetical protein SAMN05445756_0413 [Kytococcus aerolatus]